jgi:hypothetical protein
MLPARHRAPILCAPLQVHCRRPEPPDTFAPPGGGGGPHHGWARPGGSCVGLACVAPVPRRGVRDRRRWAGGLSSGHLWATTVPLVVGNTHECRQSWLSMAPDTPTCRHSCLSITLPDHRSAPGCELCHLWLAIPPLADKRGFQPPAIPRSPALGAIDSRASHSPASFAGPSATPRVRHADRRPGSPSPAHQRGPLRHAAG